MGSWSWLLGLGFVRSQKVRYFCNPCHLHSKGIRRLLLKNTSGLVASSRRRLPIRRSGSRPIATAISRNSSNTDLKGSAGPAASSLGARLTAVIIMVRDQRHVHATSAEAENGCLMMYTIIPIHRGRGWSSLEGPILGAAVYLGRCRRRVKSDPRKAGK